MEYMLQLPAMNTSVEMVHFHGCGGRPTTTLPPAILLPAMPTQPSLLPWPFQPRASSAGLHP